MAAFTSMIKVCKIYQNQKLVVCIPYLTHFFKTWSKSDWVGKLSNLRPIFVKNKGISLTHHITFRRIAKFCRPHVIHYSTLCARHAIKFRTKMISIYVERILWALLVKTYALCFPKNSCRMYVIRTSATNEKKNYAILISSELDEFQNSYIFRMFLELITCS